MSRASNSVSPASVGVFDSGVGGLSVLRELYRALPQAALRYVADSAHAPYGERSDRYVIDRSCAITQHLLDHGAEVIVVACNTATAVAIGALRDRWPEVPFVGVEPGLKPASQITRNGRVGVLATRVTLASERFARLAAAQPAHVTIVPQPCPGLARLIEQIDTHTAPIDESLDGFCAPLRAAGVDTVVLGCTHYTFVAERIAQRLGPGIAIVDTAEAIARQTARLLADAAAASSPHQGAPGPTSSTSPSPSPTPILQTTGALGAFARVTQHLWHAPGRLSAGAIDG